VIILPFVLLAAAAVFSVIIPYSLCMVCSLMFSVLTGENVPNPTWSVTNSVSIPFSEIFFRSRFVKCKPAVGAATEPCCFA